ncbi:MAG TPA: DNA methyltransferase [Candidatus Obscuribacterales bacterium]
MAKQIPDFEVETIVDLAVRWIGELLETLPCPVLQSEDRCGEQRKLQDVLYALIVRTVAIVSAEKCGVSLCAGQTPEDWIAHGLVFPFDDRARKVVIPRITNLLRHTSAISYDWRSTPVHSLGLLYEELLCHKIRTRDGKPFLMPVVKEKRRRGVFYTPASLAEPAAAKLIERLTRAPKSEAEGDTNGSSFSELRSLNDILSMRIVDPAMGAGSFLLAALKALGEASDARLALDLKLQEKSQVPNALRQDVRQRIARQCLYGVDIDPVAVDIARLSLWLTTEDTAAHPSELYGNLRCGNALLGCTRQQIEAYPQQASSRIARIVPRSWDGADGIARRARAVRKEAGNQQLSIDFFGRGGAADGDGEHGEGDCGGGKDAGEGGGEHGGMTLKERMDLWCSLWFWPVADAESFPLEEEYLRPSDGTRASSQAIAQTKKFFHWELEFPQVFSCPNAGFDAVLSNPPWEIEKPNSREFFGQHDPEYWALGKQQALKRQEQILAQHPELAREWKDYLESLEAMSNWTQLFSYQGAADVNAYKMFLELGHKIMRNGGLMTQIIPAGLYTDQGALKLRRLFLRHSRWLMLQGFENRFAFFDIHRSFKFCTILIEKGGKTDEIDCVFLLKGDTTNAATFKYDVSTIAKFSPNWNALLEFDQDRDLHVMEKIWANSKAVADRHRLFNSRKEESVISFRREIDMTNDSHLFRLRDDIESEGCRSDEYGRWLYGRWQCRTDSRLPAPVNVDEEERLVFSHDSKYQIRQGDIEKIFLPLYEGRMIGQYDFSRRGWVSGKGRQAVWRDVPFSAKQLLPQYLIDSRDYEFAGDKDWKVGFLGVGSPTNARSMIAAALPGFPCGNSVPVLRWQHCFDVSAHDRLRTLLVLTAVLNSYVFDYALRTRLAANNLNWFIVEECPLPPMHELSDMDEFIGALASLSFTHPVFAPAWDTLADISLFSDHVKSARWRGDEQQKSALQQESALLLLSRGRSAQAVSLGTTNLQERLRLRCAIEAVIAHAYGLDFEDFAWIMRDCDLDSEFIRSRLAADRLRSKGFWRVDSHLPPAQRETVQSLSAFKVLQERGLKDLLPVNAQVPI